MRRLSILIGGALALAGMAIGVGPRLWPTLPIPEYSAVAVVLCLVPTVATFLWAYWARGQSTERQLLMVLGGTGVRMFLVLIVGFALYSLLPGFRRPSFWIVILVFYLVTLALEMAVLLPGESEPQSRIEPKPTEKLTQTES